MSPMNINVRLGDWGEAELTEHENDTTWKDEQYTKAKTGDHDALFFVGRMNLSPYSGAFKEDEALSAMIMAAERGHGPACSYLGASWLGDMFVYGFDENRLEIGLKYLTTAAGQNLPEAQWNLAMALLYTIPDPQTQDFETAVHALEELAKSHDLEAQVQLGTLFSEGPEELFNPEKALFWTQKAAETGEPEAQNLMGKFHCEGIGVEVDPILAFNFFSKAAKDGHTMAQYNLAGCYLQGTGVDIDPAQALKWAQQSADQGNALAMMGLATIYESGDLVQPDYVKAWAHYELAKEVDPFSFGSDCEENQVRLEQEMTTEQCEQAAELATKLFEKLEAPQGNLFGMG